MVEVEIDVVPEVAQVEMCRLPIRADLELIGTHLAGVGEGIGKRHSGGVWRADAAGRREAIILPLAGRLSPGSPWPDEADYEQQRQQQHAMRPRHDYPSFASRRRRSPPRRGARSTPWARPGRPTPNCPLR